jgi:ketosteroid isomerase-like protein
MALTDDELIARLMRGYEAFNSGDYDAAVDLLHPDIEFVSFGEPSPIKGAAGMRAWMEPDAFESQTIEPLAWRVNGSRILVLARVTARGAGSGIELDTRSWAVWEFNEDGLMTRVQSFPELERESAFARAGISEVEWPPEAEGGRPPGA